MSLNLLNIFIREAEKFRDEKIRLNNGGMNFGDEAERNARHGDEKSRMRDEDGKFCLKEHKKTGGGGLWGLE